jgi:transposase
MNIRSTQWLGLDISASSFDGAVAEEGGAPNLRLAVHSHKRTREGVCACLKQAGEVVGVALESTGVYSQEVATWLREARPGLRVCVLNPMQVKAYGRSLAVRNKNDRVDARVIACFAASHRPKASWVPEPERMRLRELLKERAALAQMLASDRKRPISEETGLLAEVRAGLREHLKSAIARLEAGIRELLDQHPELKADTQRLMTIHGVGLIVSTTVLAILGDLRRFERGRQLAAFAGVSPQQQSSGSSVRGRTRMCKQGSSRVRRVLYLAAMAAVRMEGPLRSVYEALIARGKRRKAALGAIMRRLLLIMRALLVNGTDYQTESIPGAAA